MEYNTRITQKTLDAQNKQINITNQVAKTRWRMKSGKEYATTTSEQRLYECPQSGTDRSRWIQRYIASASSDSFSFANEVIVQVSLPAGTLLL